MDKVYHELDIRQDEEYQRGSNHKAISIPMEELSKKMEELNRTEIIAYCRAPKCACR